MPRLISGYLEKPSKVIMFDETDYSIEYSADHEAGAFQIDDVADSNKLIMARDTADGQVIAYGNVTPYSWGYDLPTGSYVHYDAANWVSTSSWPDSNSTLSLNQSIGTVSYITSGGPNSLPYVRMGPNAYMRSPNMAAIPPAATIFSVVRFAHARAYAFSRYGFYSVGSRSGDLGLKIHLESDYTYKTYFSAFGTSVQGVAGSYADYPSNTWLVVGQRYNNVANWISGAYSGEVTVNGQRSSTTTATTYTSTGTHYMEVGYDYENNNGNTEFAEFIYYKRALSDAEMVAAAGYLMDKYAIS